MILVVMAAGMGSRFGGLKQLTPVGPNGEFLIDYSIYDAIMVGVKKVVFVIKEEHLDQFRESIGKRIESKIKVEYAFQKLEDIPVKVDVVRTKPWGTGQAILASRKYIDDNFIVINADDFYGREAFRTLADELIKINNYKKSCKEYLMVAYNLENTLSPNGTVSRGICKINNGYLEKVTERTKVIQENDEIVYLEDGNKFSISEDSSVSVNLFGFTKEIFEDADRYFREFLEDTNGLESREFYLPFIVQKSIDEGIAIVRVINTSSKFSGMTYQEDLEEVRLNINQLIKDGVYPIRLWRNYDEK